MSVEPLVSVIIPAFNAADTIGMQLDSLADQAAAPPFEVIVVDDGSADATARQAIGHGTALGLNLRVVSATVHQGASYARNVGARHARTNLLMFCDADDVLGESWLYNGLQCFRTAEFWSGSARLLTDDQFNTDSYAHVRSHFPSSSKFEIPNVEQSGRFPILNGNTFGIRKHLFYKLGGFDQSFGSNGEDNEFGYRAARAGHQHADAHCVTVGYRGRWEPKVRRKLARRSARSHALLVTRYGVRHLSPYPHTVPEAGKVLLYPLLAVAGVRKKNWEEYGYRIARWIGFAEGRLRYGVLKQDRGPMLGVGLEERP